MRKKLVVNFVSLSCLVLSGGGCKEKVADMYVTEVANLTHEEEQVSNLRYDRDGNLVKYGDIPVVYEGDQVIVGDKTALNAKDMFYSVTFRMGKGKAQESTSSCLLEWQDSIYTVEKLSMYEYKGDTLNVCSDYCTVPERHFLRKVQEKFVFDKEGRLKDVFTVYTEANDSSSVYHACYNYDKNITCESNLNLQAYVIDCDGFDKFFYFLLNLGKMKNQIALPNEVSCSVNNGAHDYKVYPHYRMNNEHPIRIEVLYNNTKLLSRIDFSYKPLD